MTQLIGTLVVISGVLAPADPGVLEAVEDRRVRHGWGLHELAEPGTVLMGVDDCSLLGADGWLIADGRWQAARVVDCTCSEHVTLASLGLAADVSKASLGHKMGLIIVDPKFSD